MAWVFSITGFITLKTQAAGSPIGTFGDDGEGAIGASRGADLATCDAPSPQRIDIRLGSEHNKLRRHHSRSAPIAILQWLSSHYGFEAAARILNVKLPGDEIATSRGIFMPHFTIAIVHLIKKYRVGIILNIETVAVFRNRSRRQDPLKLRLSDPVLLFKKK